MRCPRCGGKVKFIAGGAGHCDPPGYYFYSGVLFAGVAGGLFWQHVPGWPLALAVMAATLVAWSFVARSTGYIGHCTRCKLLVPSQPWTL